MAVHDPSRMIAKMTAAGMKRLRMKTTDCLSLNQESDMAAIQRKTAPILEPDRYYLRRFRGSTRQDMVEYPPGLQTGGGVLRGRDYTLSRIAVKR